MVRRAWFLVVLLASVLLVTPAAALSLPGDAPTVDRKYDWSTCVYDEPIYVAQGFTVERAASVASPLDLAGFAVQADVVAGHLYVHSLSVVAPRTTPGGDLVPFDPEWASRQVAGQNFPGATGYATTPGGRTLSVHGAERIYLGAPGRNPVDSALVDSILDTGTRVGYRPGNATVRVSAPNLCGRCYVVVDADTGTHVVTVMIPK